MKYISFIMLVLIVSLTLHYSAEAQYSLQNSVFGNGGGVVENDSYRIVGTLGQPVIGVTAGPAYQHFAGAWYVIGALSQSTHRPERTLSIAVAEAIPGGEANVQVEISDATGIAGGEILIKYDPDMVTISDVTETDLISGMILIANKDVTGEIKLVIAGSQGIQAGSGALASIGLTINSDIQYGAEITLSFGHAEIYDESGAVIPVNLESGVVKITGIRGDVNGDGRIGSNDAILILRITAGMMTPTDEQNWAADVNGDGAVRANDAILLLRKAAGLAAPNKDIIARVEEQVVITLAEAHGVAGESIVVPLKVDGTAALAGGDICISYDSSVLRAVDATSGSNIMMASNLNESGLVRIAFAGSDRLISKTLFNIKFDILTNRVSPLKLQQVELYQSDARRIDSKLVDGEFRSWAIPAEHNALRQNFPNPFNPETWIPYELKEGGRAEIRIFSIQGQLIRELDLGYRPAGVYISTDRAARWDGKNEAGETVASGIYFYSITAGDFCAMRKMTVRK